jgi:hypothetical protein
VEVELPEHIPTGAAIGALHHVLDHGHDGVDPIQHFLGALVDQLGLADPADRELDAAEKRMLQALHAHPRDRAELKAALAAVQLLTRARDKKR